MLIFNKRLREIRKSRKLTQQELADKVNVAMRTYQCWEQGKHAPSYDVLIMLADILNISVDYLLGRDEFIENQNNEANHLNKDKQLKCIK